MDNGKLLSIIVPVHNDEATLRGCIDSVFRGVKRSVRNQAEVILVVNGSKDRSYQVAVDLVCDYGNDYVRLITSAEGVSRARNAGLNIAWGKWIFFLDADDRLTLGGLDTLVKVAGEDGNEDLICFNYYSRKQEVNLISTDASVELSVTDKLDLDALRLKFIKNPTKMMTAWAKLYRRDVLDQGSAKDKALRFVNDLTYAEDSGFVLEYLLRAKSVGLNGTLIYDHCPNDQSVINCLGDGKDYFESGVAVIVAYNEALRHARLVIDKNVKEDAVSRYLNGYVDYVVANFNVILVNCIYGSLGRKDVSYRDRIGLMQELCRSEEVVWAMSKLSFGDCLSLRKLPILLAKVHQYWATGLIGKVKAKRNLKALD